MSEVYFLPLGGTGEIGMNLNLYGYKSQNEEEWIMIDCGVTFSQAGLPGIDLQMADPNFIAKKKENLLGIILTHAHEDHIGAMPYIWPHFKCPIYTTKFTASLLEEKFIENQISFEEKLIIIEDNQVFNIGSFGIKALGLSHSIPEMSALFIETPELNIFHSGDWKIDSEPVAGGSFDQNKSEDNYEFEPDEDEILSNLLPKNISTQIFKAMLENSASEQGARMSAMDNATRNAGEMVDKLTIEYNRSRQAAITKELIEIISGAESL